VFYLVDHTASRRIDRPAEAGPLQQVMASRRGGSVLELYTSDVHLAWAA